MKEGIKKFIVRLSYVLFALLISAALWMFVEITDNEVQVLSIPAEIRLKNVELLNSRGLLVSRILADNVEVTFEGPRREMGNLRAGEVYAEIDLESVRSTGSVELNYTVILPDNINTNDINILNPTYRIYLQIDRMSTIERAIEVTYTGGTVSDEFIAEPAEFEPRTIEISGPEERVSQIAHVYVPIAEENLSTTFTGEFGYILVDENGDEIDLSLPEFESLQFSHDEIRVTIPIKQRRALPLHVDLYFGDSKTTSDINTSWNVEPMEITVSGDPEVFRDMAINSINLGSINMSSFALQTVRTIPIIVPDGLTNISGETSATVTVEVSGLMSEVRSVSNIQAINEPAGYVANIITQSLDVRLRGTASNLALVRNENILVYVDLTDYNPGGSSITPSFAIAGVDADVDIVLRRDNVDYIVTVTVTREDEELND